MREIFDEKKTQKVVEWLNEATGSVSYWWFNAGTYGVTQSNGACHIGVQGTFKDKKHFTSIEWYVGNCAFPKQASIDYIREYLDWVFSEDSPWWNVHKGDIQLIRHKEYNTIIGFILGPSVFKDHANASYVYNMLIAARFPRDHYHYIGRISALKKAGLSYFQAFVLSGFATRESSTGNWIFARSPMWNGAHQPLVLENSGPYITEKLELDLMRLRKGEYNLEKGEVSVSSTGWMKPLENGGKGIFTRLKNSGAQKTRFSVINKISEENFIKFGREHIPS